VNGAPAALPPANGAWSVASAFQGGAGDNVLHSVAVCSLRLPGGAAFALVETAPNPERPRSFAHAICNAFCEAVAKEAARTRPPLKPAAALQLLRVGVEAKGVGEDARECPDQTALLLAESDRDAVVRPIGGALLGVVGDDAGLAVAFVGEPILWLLGREAAWGKCDAVLRHGRVLRDEATPDRARLLHEMLYAELPDVRCAYAVSSALVRDAAHATVTGGFRVPHGPADAERAVHQLLRESLGRQRDRPETSDGVGVVCAVRCAPEGVDRKVGRPALYWATAGALGIGALVGATALHTPLYAPAPIADAPSPDPASTAVQGAPPVPIASEASAATDDDLLPDCPQEPGSRAAPAPSEASPAAGAP